MVKIPTRNGLAFELIPVSNPSFTKVDEIISKL
jgi:uncharacterized GH25 family protein